MINVNELRQGNLVYDLGTIIKIDYRNSDWWHTDNYKPIDLTPDIIGKIGDLDHNKLHLASFEYDEVKKCVWLDFEGTICGVEIYHLHHFQNIYLDLTGEELNVDQCQV